MDNERDNEFSRESDSHNITRRDALKIVSGTIGAFTFAALVGGNFLDAFGVTGSNDDSSEDINQGDGLEAGHGREYVWFDRGGFYGVNSPSNLKQKPEQGWGEASIKYFEKLMVAELQKLPLAKDYPFTGIRTNKKRHEYPKGSGKQYNDRDYYYEVARIAIENCIERETENARRGGYEYSGKARVVGVAWNWQRDDEVAKTWYQFVPLKNSTFDKMFPRKPTREETYTGSPTASDSAWEEDHNDLSFPRMSWRDYVYEDAKKNLTRNDYNLIVIAVADGIPTPMGSLTVKKKYDGDPNKQFKFRVTFSGNRAPDNKVQEFTLKNGESHTIEKLNHGVSYVVEELTTGYDVTWIPSSKGVINVYKELAVTLVCENKSGALQLEKDVTD